MKMVPVEPLIETVEAWLSRQRPLDNSHARLGLAPAVGTSLARSLYRARERGTASIYLADKVCQKIGASLTDVYPPIPADGEGWEQSGACRGQDSDLWWDPKYAQVGKRICGTCDVRDACLRFAVSEDIPDGIWGGLDGRERARWARQNNAA